MLRPYLVVRSTLFAKRVSATIFFDSNSQLTLPILSLLLIVTLAYFLPSLSVH